jgi:hypothetical protein
LIKWALSEVKRQEDEAAAKREEALAERIPAFPDLGTLPTSNTSFNPFQIRLMKKR